MAVKGNDIVFYVVDENNVPQPLVCNRDFMLSMTSDVIETTSRGSGNYKTYEPTKIGYSINLTNISEFIEGINSQMLNKALQSRTKINWIAEVNSAQYFSGRVIVTSTEFTAPNNDISVFQGTLLGDGEIVVSGTVPIPPEASGYYRVFLGDPRLSTNGDGQLVFTDTALIGKEDYLVYASQLNQYIPPDQISYNATTGSFTILVPGFVLEPSPWELDIFPNNLGA